MSIPILGDLWGKIVDKAGGIISELVTDKDLAKQLDHAFRTQMATAEAEYKTLELETESKLFEAQQKTIQAELQQSDLYTKQTRPKIATKSFYAGLAYVLVSQLPTNGLTLIFFTLMPWQFNWEVLMLLYSPALTYMGVRGFEKWKSGGAKV